MKKSSKKDYFNIPNLLCYFRILLIPVYLMVYIGADGMYDYSIAALIIFISGMTDFLDGKIARKYNMVTEFGKIIDPVADKLTQVALVISLTYRYPLMYVVLTIFVIKELIMSFAAYWFLRYGKKMNGAQIYGKICTASVYTVMILLVLFPQIPEAAANSLMAVCIVTLIYAFVSYMLFYKRMYKELKNEISK